MIGIATILIGICLRAWAYFALREQFTLHLQPLRHVVRKGPYRWMRHPSYLGSICIIAGGALWSPVIGVLLLTWAFFCSRITQEEVILMQDNDYREYAARIGWFFPKKRWSHGDVSSQ